MNKSLSIKPNINDQSELPDEKIIIQYYNVREISEEFYYFGTDRHQFKDFEISNVKIEKLKGEY